MSRKSARELVLHFTFESEYTGESGKDIMEKALKSDNFAGLKEEYKLYEKMPEENQMEYVTAATSGVISHMQELDSYIEKYSKGWNVGRISRISKAIIRLSMYEILYMSILMVASVKEAVKLSKKSESEAAAYFRKGVLPQFSKHEIIG